MVPQTSPVYPIFPSRGSINTSHVMFQDGALHMTIEDWAIPPMFATLARAGLNVLEGAARREPFLRMLRGLWFLGRLPDLLPDLADPERFQTEHEMVANVFFFNCMGTDGAQGKFDLDARGHLSLSFTGGRLVDHPVFQKIEGILKAMAEKMGGRYVPFPFCEGFGLDRKVITVHPLGVCPMGQSSTKGVVDTQGRVFNTRRGATTVHQGLYVMDASMIPGPLAVNPTLTIVALALKMAAAIP